MPRVTKHPLVRREELLDVAFALCRSHGFEGMSVEQVTASAGVAKGTFYHYFTSKSDLQGQLVGRFGDSLFNHLTDALVDVQGSGAQRLGGLMNAAASYKSSQADIGFASFLYRDENFALRHRLYDAWRERARSVLTPVIQDGLDDGSIRAADAGSATDLVLLLWFDAADHLWNRALRTADAAEFAAVLAAGSAAITQAQERILGVPDGTYSIPVPTGLIAAIEQLHPKLDRTKE
ncbi:MAG TPA: TetR/AcrR family transcriptional regulator [Propionicimonas sp.]|nr:TetR/AcrR family transcriptional regulator [Propionicimonas sp.]HRA06253.1 TetR/AcrR family transcriptional regulator [Propionicimonas sp.]